MGLVSVFALVFQHAPLPTSPADGGGVTAPSPPAGRVGVGAMFKSHCKDAYEMEIPIDEETGEEMEYPDERALEEMGLSVVCGEIREA